MQGLIIQFQVILPSALEEQADEIGLRYNDDDESALTDLLGNILDYFIENKTKIEKISCNISEPTDFEHLERLFIHVTDMEKQGMEKEFGEQEYDYFTLSVVIATTDLKTANSIKNLKNHECIRAFNSVNIIRPADIYGVEMIIKPLEDSSDISKPQNTKKNKREPDRP